MQTLTILGATGSIGRSTLHVVARHPDRYRVFALCAQRRAAELYEQCLRFAPRYAALVDPRAARELADRIAAAGLDTEVLAGPLALAELSAHEEVDTVMAAIVGGAGLAPTIAAARAGKRILLANKESLVMAGEVFLRACREGGATVLPIDSEHNAVFQCLPSDGGARRCPEGVRRIVLTASGGPFRRAPLAQMRDVTPEQACAHPNWSMGRKISVDSATMMNKGLELIEAFHLFGVPAARLDVLVHPQSIVHSLVEYDDGSVLAQMGNPDMRTPIAQALAHPQRIDSGVAPLDLVAIARLEFEAPDAHRFPCLQLAREALAAGGAAPCVLNAANEIAVAAFLGRAIRFTDIAAVTEGVLQAVGSRAAGSGIEEIFAIDEEARALARAHLARCTA
ncbi:MAG: 1-deoxy-D-xylulose-5-phosphate reductoisomerase [Burkholderiaceae bacterium]|nr:1-deoxy-D-xylulose-5-phosphate reductoisomerase [Burkholderiaceae bacterium]